MSDVSDAQIEAMKRALSRISQRGGKRRLNTPTHQFVARELTPKLAGESSEALTEPAIPERDKTP